MSDEISTYARTILLIDSYFELFVIFHIKIHNYYWQQHCKTSQVLYLKSRIDHAIIVQFDFGLSLCSFPAGGDIFNFFIINNS